VRRGDVLAPRTWADIGITLAPAAVQSFPGWIAPLSANGVASPASSGPQTVFQLQAMPAPGTLEYTIEIDGQQLRYRNTPPVWFNMVHPGPGTSGARITALTFDGRTVELFNELGQFGLKRMIEAAAKKRKEGGVHELRWSGAGGALSVAVDLKITSSAEANAGSGSAAGQGFRGMRLPPAIVGRQVDAGAGAPAMAAAGGVQ